PAVRPSVPPLPSSIFWLERLASGSDVGHDEDHPRVGGEVRDLEVDVVVGQPARHLAQVSRPVFDALEHERLAFGGDHVAGPDERLPCGPGVVDQDVEHAPATYPRAPDALDVDADLAQLLAEVCELADRVVGLDAEVRRHGPPPFSMD